MWGGCLILFFRKLGKKDKPIKIRNSYLKIHSIRISNILSFEHYANLDDCEEILFDDGLNILIGPNGAGKSNFLEILNQIFTRLFFRQCIFLEDQFQQNLMDPGQFPLNKTLRSPAFPPSSLRQNNETPNEIKQIRLTIKVGNEDIQNLQFIQQNIVALMDIAKIYCNQNNIAPDEYNQCVFTHPFQVTYDIQIDADGNLSTTSPATKPLQLIIQRYLQWFEFIQKLIHLGNIREGKDWEPLKNSFAVISGYRNYDTITTSYPVSDSTKSAKLTQIREKITRQSLQKSNAEEPLVFQYVKNYLAYEYDRIRNDVADNPQGINAEDILKKDLIYRGINAALSKTLEIKLDISKNPSGHDYLFNFKDERGLIQNSELSAGQKGIIHFIFSLYGYELKNGMLIIDEPELHVHPQIQEKYVEIIRQVEKDLGIQFVIATHSPVFVTPDTISGIHRFGLENNFTRITTPKINTHTSNMDDQDLVRILNYTNNAKVFFAKKVILVEGDTDEYVFQTLLKNFITNKSKTGIEFLEIGGTPNYLLWKDFLDKCGIQSYFIGDLDVILREELNIINKTTKDQIKNDFENDPITIQNVTNDANYLKHCKKDFLNFIKNHAEWNNISSRMSQFETKGMFILKNGELEEYIGNFVNGKLANVVEFCKNHLHGWYSSNPNASEINSIFVKII